MKKQQFVTVLAVLGMCACMVLAVHQRWRFPLVNAVVNTVLLPVNAVVRQINDAVVSFRENQRLNATLQEENSRLKKELEALRSAEYRLKQLEAENTELLAMAGYRQQRDDLKLLPARVIGVSLGDLHEFFFLDKGSADGVLAGMVVTTSEGMAGVVDQVYRHYSRFMLISANRSRIGIRVLRKESRAVGVLTGQGPNLSLLQGEYFGRDDDVQTGDMLVTSGIGGKYPAGLLVGTVRGVEADVTGLQKLVQIEPAYRKRNSGRSRGGQTMKMWSWIAAAFVVLVLQTTSLGCFGGNLFFDLPLLFIYSVGLFYGARAGLVCGLAFGLLQDVSSPAVFGFYMLTRGLVGYGTGSIKEMIFKNNYGYHVLIIGFISLLLRALYAVPVFWLAGFRKAALFLYLQDSLLYCLGNMLLVLPVTRILLALYRWVAEDDLTY